MITPVDAPLTVVTFCCRVVLYCLPSVYQFHLFYDSVTHLSINWLLWRNRMRAIHSSSGSVTGRRRCKPSACSKNQRCHSSCQKRKKKAFFNCIFTDIFDIKGNYIFSSFLLSEPRLAFHKFRTCGLDFIEKFHKQNILFIYFFYMCMGLETPT